MLQWFDSLGSHILTAPKVLQALNNAAEDPIGRALVSKTSFSRFESYLPCQTIMKIHRWFRPYNLITYNASDFREMIVKVYKEHFRDIPPDCIAMDLYDALIKRGWVERYQDLLWIHLPPEPDGMDRFRKLGNAD